MTATLEAPAAAPLTALPAPLAQLIPVARLHSHPNNPRQKLGTKTELGELASSIAANGLLEPLVVVTAAAWNAIAVTKHRVPDGDWVVHAGHRRLAAITDHLKLLDAPCIVNDAIAGTTGRSLLAMLVENMQRQDLDPVEEANAFDQVMKAEKFSQRDVAAAIGRDQAYVQRRLSLLKIGAEMRKAVQAKTVDLTAAVELAKVAGDKEVLAAATQSLLRGSQHLSPKQMIDHAQATVERDRALDKTLAELRAKGFTVVDAAPGYSNGVGRGLAVNMTVDKHAKLSCHVVTVSRGYAGGGPPTVNHYCTTPKLHKKAVAPTPEEVARAAERQRDRLWKSATQPRRSWLTEVFLPASLPAAEQHRLAEDLAFAHHHTDYDGERHWIAAELLGYPVPARNARYGKANPVDDLATGSQAQRDLFIRALYVAMHENLHTDVPLTATGRAYFLLLERNGYPLTEIEAEVLVASDPDHLVMPATYSDPADVAPADLDVPGAADSDVTDTVPPFRVGDVVLDPDGYRGEVVEVTPVPDTEDWDGGYEIRVDYDEDTPRVWRVADLTKVPEDIVADLAAAPPRRDVDELRVGDEVTDPVGDTCTVRFVSDTTPRVFTVDYPGRPDTHGQWHRGDLFLRD